MVKGVLRRPHTLILIFSYQDVLSMRLQPIQFNLLELGLNHDRFTIGRSNTEEEFDRLAEFPGMCLGLQDELLEAIDGTPVMMDRPFQTHSGLLVVAIASGDSQRDLDQALTGLSLRQDEKVRVRHA